MRGRKRARPHSRGGKRQSPSPRAKSRSSDRGWPLWHEIGGKSDSSTGAATGGDAGEGAGTAAAPAPLSRLLQAMARHDDRIRLRTQAQAQSKAKAASEPAPPKSSRRKEKDKAYWDRVKQREEQTRHMQAVKARVPCKFFARGRCAKGAQCPYSHRPRKEEAAPAPSQGAAT